MKVDLTLAVNYLPACACLCKLLCLMMLLSIFQPNDGDRGGYIPVAALRYMDRLSTRNLIFDANSILLAVFFANIHATIRATCTHTVHPLITTIPFLLWTVSCLAILIEPAPVRRLLERRALASKFAPVLIMLGILVVSASVFSPMEPIPIRTCRALAFTLLSFVWIYMVGIHAPQGIDFLKENSYQFVTRLAPVLYAPLWMACPFPLIAGGMLAWQYIHKAQAQESHEPPLQSVEVEAPESADEATMKELFRQAKMARTGPAPE
jgi:hypothetical protein